MKEKKLAERLLKELEGAMETTRISEATNRLIEIFRINLLVAMDSCLWNKVEQRIFRYRMKKVRSTTINLIKYKLAVMDQVVVNEENNYRTITLRDVLVDTIKRNSRMCVYEQTISNIKHLLWSAIAMQENGQPALARVYWAELITEYGITMRWLQQDPNKHNKKREDTNECNGRV